MSKRKPTQKESENYWDSQFDPAADLVEAFVDDALGNKQIDLEALAMSLLEWACVLQCVIKADDDEAHRVIAEDIEEIFRESAS